MLKGFSPLYQTEQIQQLTRAVSQRHGLFVCTDSLPPVRKRSTLLYWQLWKSGLFC